MEDRRKQVQINGVDNQGKQGRLVQRSQFRFQGRAYGENGEKTTARNQILGSVRTNYSEDGLTSNERVRHMCVGVELGVEVGDT